jgi:hypothetical protein
LAAARHYKQISIPLPHFGFEEGTGATTFAPAALGLGAPDVCQYNIFIYLSNLAFFLLFVFVFGHFS